MSQAEPRRRASREIPAVIEQLQTLRCHIQDAASPQERADWLVQLRQVIDVSESHFVNALATFDALGDAELLNAAPNAVGWLQGSLHLSAADAA